MSRTRDQLEAYLKNLHIDCDYLLDVGGSQRPVSERLGSLKANQIEILDLSVPHETKQKPDFQWDLNKDIELAVMIDPKEFEKPDVIFCLEVFDYIWNPVVAMNNLAKLLRKGGILYVSFPFIYPHHNPVEQDMLRYTEFGAKKLIEQAGLKVIEQINRVADMEVAMDFFQSEGMRAARNYQNHNVVTFNFVCKK